MASALEQYQSNKALSQEAIRTVGHARDVTLDTTWHDYEVIWDDGDVCTVRIKQYQQDTTKRFERDEGLYLVVTEGQAAIPADDIGMYALTTLDKDSGAKRVDVVKTRVALDALKMTKQVEDEQVDEPARPRAH